MVSEENVSTNRSPAVFTVPYNSCVLTKSLQRARHILARTWRKIHGASKPIPCLRIEKIGFDQSAVSPTKFCERLFRDSGIIEFQHATEDALLDRAGIHVELSRHVRPNPLATTRARRL
jgi:hypothetical protein